MLSRSQITATIPSTDISKTKDFYTKKIGLSLVSEEEGMLMLEAEDKSRLLAYERPPAKSEHTLVTFLVNDIEKEVEELTAKGVVFEQYDSDWIKTDERGIAEFEGQKAAWFKDPDQNILGIAQK